VRTLVAVTSPSHASPPPTRPRRRLNAWRVGTPVAILLSGALFAVSAVNSEGTDLRPGRYTDLNTVVEQESRRVQVLRRQLGEVNTEIGTLTDAVPDAAVRKEHRATHRLEKPAGLTPQSGPGLSITLSDAPDDLIRDYEDAGGNANDLLVHQQDIQAVVNALWRGGARAIAIEGQRIITTTGIKCYGSTVQLHGVLHPAPYTITAVGEPADLRREIDADPHIATYRQYAEAEDFQLGWEATEEPRATVPAYDGPVNLDYAAPLG